MAMQFALRNTKAQMVVILPPVGARPREGRHMTTRVEAGLYEQLAGRWLALCLHPIAAWRATSNTERGLILVAYFTIGTWPDSRS